MLVPFESEEDESANWDNSCIEAVLIRSSCPAVCIPLLRPAAAAG